MESRIQCCQSGSVGAPGKLSSRSGHEAEWKNRGTDVALYTLPQLTSASSDLTCLTSQWRTPVSGAPRKPTKNWKNYTLIINSKIL